MEIKNYEVLINEQQASCGLVVNKDLYDISFLNNHDIYYEILDKEHKIKIYSDSNEVVFCNASHETLYFAHKTEVLIILMGILTPEPKFSHVFEAVKPD